MLCLACDAYLFYLNKKYMLYLACFSFDTDVCQTYFVDICVISTRFTRLLITHILSKYV